MAIQAEEPKSPESSFLNILKIKFYAFDIIAWDQELRISYHLKMPSSRNLY